jgi:hypothetical protein
MALTASACTDQGPFQLCGGPLAGARASAGSPSGQFFQQAGSTIWQPAAGVRAAADLALGNRFSLGLEALGAAVFGSGSFTVEGADEPRRLSHIDLVLALRLGWSGF